MRDLEHKHVAVLATGGFEQSELTEPVNALRAAGATVSIVSLKPGEIQGMQHDDKGEKIKADLELSLAKPEEFDALVLPGGVANPDKLRVDQQAIAFIAHFVEAKKPIGAICHGPWTLIEADAVRGRTMAAWPSLETDLKNAGANWVDRSVVVDGNLVTSHRPDDLPDFNRELLALIEKTAAQSVPNAA